MGADVGSGAAEVVTAWREGEFPEGATVWMRRKGLVGAGVEAHPAISTKKERASASHGFVGYDIHPNREGRGRRAIMVELDGHSGLLVRAEQLSGSEPAPSSGCGGSDARRVSGTQGDHLVKGSFMDERLRRARVQKGAAVKSRRRGDSAVE